VDPVELKRYRWTPGAMDVPFLMGAIGASALSGPALVGLLQQLGKSESAARNLLTRMTAMGALDVRSQGRINVYRVAASSTARYQEVEGTARENPWSGSFHALIYSVPETQRILRDRVLHIGQSAGYGLLRPGVLIAVGDRWDRLRLDSDEFTGDAWITRTVLTPSSLTDAKSMAATAWDLPGLAAAYRTALQAASDVPKVVTPGPDALIAWRDLYSSFLEAQLRDPGLPGPLLPPDWPAARFLDAQQKVNMQIGRVLQPALREQADRQDPAGVNEFYTSPWT
jgi:phenylacetic acid degradation operon negative regulatory protein